MVKKLSVLFLLLVFSINIFSQNQPIKSKKVRISGYIYDSKSKETLIGATVYDLKSKVGTTTNNYGFYSISIPEGNSEVVFSYVGYEKQIIKARITKDTSLLIYLKQSTTLEEVTIEGKSESKRFIEEATPGKIVINPSTITALPSLTGESDLLKSLQLLPGVKSGTEGTTGLYVRGGNIDQNLYLVDGIPIYNPNHLMGFISTFNTDAIKNIEFYKGSFPARYGGRASSVVDIRMKDGNMDKVQGDASIGLISAKFNIEGPIYKDKTTFNISARRTYLDLLLRPVIAYQNSLYESEDVDFGYYFTDVNFKINHVFNPKNRLTASLYWGEDKYKFSVNEKNNYTSESAEYSSEDKIEAGVKWGNLISNINWAYELSNIVFGNLSFSYNRYRSNINTKMITSSSYNSNDIKNEFELNFFSGIEDFSLKNDYNIYINGWNSINCGLSYTFHTYSPEVTSVSGSNNNVYEEYYKMTNRVIGNEIIAYVEDEMNFTEKFSINPGIHFNIFNVGDQTYLSLQPRFGMRYSIFKNLSFKGGYAMMNQNIHLLANGIVSMPTDLWVPVTEKIKPITTHQLSGGLFYSLKDWVNISAEGYYKKLNNVIDYKDGISSFSTSENWESKVDQGFGEAYGMEFMAQRNNGNTTGWISYTLSWAYREFPNGGINGGRRYFDKYDSRHQINITLIHKFSEKFDIAASWVFNTGSRVSIPIASYYNPMDNEEDNDYSEILNVYGDRNNFKMPNYHRLDLSLNFHKKKKYGKSTWSINIYNAYNRKNAMFLSTGDSPTTLKAYSIMPFIPTLSYTYSFR